MNLILPLIFMFAAVGMFSKKITRRTWIFLAIWILAILIRELTKPVVMPPKPP